VAEVNRGEIWQFSFPRPDRRRPVLVTHIRYLVNLLPVAPRVGDRLAFDDAADTALKRAFFPRPFNVSFSIERLNNAAISYEIGTPCDGAATGATQDEVRVDCSP
jgi:hypothetical protein